MNKLEFLKVCSGIFMLMALPAGYLIDKKTKLGYLLALISIVGFVATQIFIAWEF